MTATVRVKPDVWWRSHCGPVVIKEQRWDAIVRSGR